MVTNLIAVGTSVRGEITVDGHLRIEGRFEGMIENHGRVSISQTAQVYGEIHAHEIIVGGLVVGTLFASKKVKLLRSGSLHGDVYTASLSTEEGGTFHGRSYLIRDETGGKA